MATSAHPRAGRSRRSDRASITLVVLCISTAIGIALASYLALCSRSMEFSQRLVQQEKANELAQVGLEEGLWALNQNTWTTSGPAGTTVWTTAGANRTASLTYPLSDSGATGQVDVTIANYASTGPTWPTITVNSTVTFANSVVRTNSLQATTQPAPLFGNAIASAESYVSFIGGGTVDSWNSDPDNNSATPAVAYSFTAGNPANYNAVVAGATNGSYGVVLTQAKVLGYVATTGLPISYSTSGSPPGKVLGPVTATGVDVDPARVGKSAFVPLASIFSVTLPTPTVSLSGLLGIVVELLQALLSLPASGGTILCPGNVTLDGSSLLGLLSSTLTIDKPTKMIVNGNLALTSTGKITITPTGSLELYVTGNVNLGGLGVINQTNDARKFALFCTSVSTSTAVVYNVPPPSTFYGTIFSANKPIDIKQNATFYGALLSRSYVRFSGAATAPIFHYDSALRKTRFTTVSTPYLLGQVIKL